MEFLRSLLSPGPLSVKEIEAHAIEARLLTEGKPISQSKPFRSARKILSVKYHREGGLAGDGRWIWELPQEPKMPESNYDAPHSVQGIIGVEGHLRRQADYENPQA